MEEKTLEIEQLAKQLDERITILEKKQQTTPAQPAQTTPATPTKTTSSSSTSTTPSKTEKQTGPLFQITYLQQTQTQTQTQQSTSQTSYTRENPFKAKLLSAKLLSSFSTDVKPCFEIRLDLSSSGIQHQPGEAYGILVENRKEDVSAILKALNLDGNQTIQLSLKSGKELPNHLPSFPITIETLFSKYLDLLFVPKKAFLKQLSDFSTDATKKAQLLNLSGREGADEYRKLFSQDWLLVDLISYYSCSSIGLDVLMEHIPPLQPRFYSATNSLDFTPNTLEIAFNVFSFKTSTGKDRFGLCSNWLEKIAMQRINNKETKEEIFIPIFPRVNSMSKFRVPSELNVPMILIGPGTGVAPFRAFLQHRKQQQKTTNSITSDIYLFFGCRYSTKDFIYETDLKQFEKDGVLKELITSFSRENPQQKVYVQHKMKERGALIANLLTQQNAYLFVCGDARAMVRDVMEVLKEILATHASMNPKQSMDFIANMMKSGKYVAESW